MKNKLLLLTAFLLAPVFAGAQGIEFKYKGETLEDGASVTIFAAEDIFGAMSCETNPSDAPQDGLLLECPPMVGSTVTAELQILSNTLKASTIQWCMGGECSLVGSKTQLEKIFSPGPTAQVLLDATNIIGEGSLSAKLSVSLNNQTKTVYIQFVNEDATGVNNIERSQSYNAYTVYDLSGRKVNSQLPLRSRVPLANPSAFSTFNFQLKKGIYIVDGKKILRQ